MNQLNLKNGQSIVFRRLQAVDRELLQRFGRNLSDATRSLFSPHSYDDQTLEKVIARSESDEDRVYVAIDGEKIAAYCFLWWFDTKFPVLGIGIADEYQSLGLGKQLMSILIEDARNAGCDGVELTTVLSNERAFSLYERVGFKCLGTVENVAGDGRILKEWHMLYPFGPGAKPPQRKHEPPV